MNQNNFEDLIKKAEENKLNPIEKLELIRELKTRVSEYNQVLEEALKQIPEENSL